MTDNLNIDQLKDKARLIRRDIINQIATAQSGHPGGSLSSADILAALYFRVMNHKPDNPHWPDRDRFILSKGHAVPVLYAALAETGYFPKEELLTFRALNSRLQGHAKAFTAPGVEMSAGSLGQGLSYSIGQCLAARLDGKSYRVWCLLGDGECQEGQVWEAAMAAGNFKLDKLTAIVDRNGVQNDGFVNDIMPLEPLADKWRAFGWHVIQIDGHDMQQIVDALEASKEVQAMPTVVIAKTIKGKGVSFMQNSASWHGKAPSPEQAEQALAEIG